MKRAYKSVNYDISFAKYSKKETRTLHKFLIRTVEEEWHGLTKHLKNVPEDKGTRMR